MHKRTNGQKYGAYMEWEKELGCVCVFRDAVGLQ